MAVPLEGGFRLSGAKQFIAAAGDADAFLVSVRHQGELALFWVPRDAAGAQLTLQRLADLSPRTLATMHGASFSGDGGNALRELALVVREVLLV